MLAMPLIRLDDPVRQFAEDCRTRTWSAPDTSRGSGASALCAGASLDAVLRSRRSMRKFSPAAVSAPELTRVLGLAFTAHGRHWPPAAGQSFSVLLAAVCVDGLAPGLYASRPHATAFAPIPAASPVPALGESYVHAPALFLVCGNVAVASRSGHGSAHAALLVGAGALGHAIWLSAISAGMVGAPFGATHHAVTAAARAAEPGMRHLFTVAVGLPDGPDVEPQAPG